MERSLHRACSWAVGHGTTSRPAKMNRLSSVRDGNLKHPMVWWGRCQNSRATCKTCKAQHVQQNNAPDCRCPGTSETSSTVLNPTKQNTKATHTHTHSSLERSRASSIHTPITSCCQPLSTHDPGKTVASIWWRQLQAGVLVGN